jgi:hypothetical protein
MDTIDIKIGDQDLTFKVEFTDDTGAGAPWGNSDGHGVVSEWTTRPKRAGELLLNQDRNSKRYYDFAEACRTALREGWDMATNKEQAAKAARADYEFLRAWCTDQWRYVIIDVTLLDEEGEPTEVRDALCGVETFNDYHETQARTMVDDLAHGFGVSWDFVSKTTFGYTQKKAG